MENLSPNCSRLRISSVFNQSVALLSLFASLLLGNESLPPLLLNVAKSARRSPNVFIEPPWDFESHSMTWVSKSDWQEMMAEHKAATPLMSSEETND